MADDVKRRAVVLGGGGPVGVAWEVGLAAGLAASGVDLGAADFLVGTSAGSLAGAMLRSGRDAATLVTEIEDAFAQGVGDSGVDQIDMGNFSNLLEIMLGSGENGVDMADVGRISLGATTISEDAFVGSVASQLEGLPWPDGFACTAVDTESGEFQVWDASSAVPLERAVASSCSVPGLFPPVTINGRRYMDGGMRSPLNADLAAGYDAVLVVSVMLTKLPAGIEDARIEAFFARQMAGVDQLQAAGASVELIEPDVEFLTLSGMGMALMDFSLVGAAADAGVRLAKQEAERIRAIW